MSSSLHQTLPPMPGQEQSLFLCLDLALSFSLMVSMRAEPNRGYANAWRTFILQPDLFADAWFVEGWFVVEKDGQVVMNEHGWIAQPDGSIVDPSILLIVSPSTPAFYFPGVVRTWKETEALENELFPHVCFDGVHGIDGLLHEGYRAARTAARRKVYTRALAHPLCLPMYFWRARDLDTPVALPLDEPPFGEKYPRLQIEHIVREQEPRLDLPFSETVAQTIGARDGRCWYNVRDAMLQMPSPFFRARAVEGWLIEQREDRILLTEHGWLHFRDRIIDPTLARKDAGAYRLEYIPGQTFSWNEIQQWAHYPLPLARFLVNSLDYQAACKDALARAEQHACETRLPLVINPGYVQLREEGTLNVVFHIWEFPVPSTLSPAVPQLLQAWWRKGRSSKLG